MSFLGSLFNRRFPPLFGLDITSPNIKLVELSQTANGAWVLEKCGTEPLDFGWVVDGNIENPDEVLLALKRLLRKTGVKTKNVAMALPNTVDITKKMMVPAGLNDVELEEQVEAEANQYIPFALEEASLDFCRLAEPPNAQGDESVMIVASRKEKVEDRLALAEGAGLNLKIMDVESFASRMAASRLIHQLSNQGDKPIVALFDIGSQSSNMQVLQDGAVLYEKEQPFGTAQLMKLIVRQYGLTMEEAVIKRRNAELPSDYKDTVLTPFTTGLSNEIGRALQFFFTSSKYNSVNHVLLAGETTQFTGLSKAISEQTSFSCSTANPFEDMQISNAVREKKLSSEASSYLTACGLAMRRFAA